MLDTNNECQDIVHHQFGNFWSQIRVRDQHVRKPGKIVFGSNALASNLYMASKFIAQKTKDRP